MSRQLIFTTAISAALLSLSSAPLAAKAQVIDPKTVCPKADDPQLKINAKEVCTLLVVVKNTLNNVSKDLPDVTPPLKSVKLSVKAETKTGVGGELNLLVIKIGASHTADTVQTLNISLKKPEAGSAITAATQAPFSRTLADSIIAAFKAVKIADLPLTTSGLSMVVSFGVENSASGGGTFQLAPISISVNGNVGSSNVQTLTFQFGEGGAE